MKPINYEIILKSIGYQIEDIDTNSANGALLKGLLKDIEFVLVTLCDKTETA